MSLVKYPRCEGTELKVYDMLTLILIGGALAVTCIVITLEDISKKREAHALGKVRAKIVHERVVARLAGNGVKIRWYDTQSFLTEADYTNIMKGISND